MSALYQGSTTGRTARRRGAGLILGLTLGLLLGAGPRHGGGCGRQPEGPRLLGAIPILAVPDVRQAVEYYRDVLDFPHTWVWDDEGNYGGAIRDDVGVHFMLHPELAERSKDNVFYVYMERGLDDLWALQKQRGAHMHCDPHDTEWGMREFIVRDLNGYLIRFGQPLACVGSGGPARFGYPRSCVSNCTSGSGAAP